MLHNRPVAVEASSSRCDDKKTTPLELQRSKDEQLEAELQEKEKLARARLTRPEEQKCGGGFLSRAHPQITTLI